MGMFFLTMFPGSSGDGGHLSPRSTLPFPPPGLDTAFLSPASALSKANSDPPPAVPTPLCLLPCQALLKGRKTWEGLFHCQQAQAPQSWEGTAEL